MPLRKTLQASFQAPLASGVKNFNGDFGAEIVREFAQRLRLWPHSGFFVQTGAILCVLLRT
jgi:hypothetical protein